MRRCLSAGVIAHTSRAEQAHALRDTLQAQYLHMDNGHWGCKRSHIRTWEYLATATSTWSLAIEDDAEPVHGFAEQLEQVLTAAPTPIVSLYLGRGYPPQWQDRIRQAIHTADREHAHWIVADNHLHGVAVAIKTELIPDMLGWVKPSTQPIDYAIRDWARNNHHPIGFTHPSLVEHADLDSIATHEDGGARLIPRKAWRVGTRQHWTRRQVTL